MPVVELTSSGLAATDVIAVAREGVRVTLSGDARAAMERSAAVVASLVDAEEPAYGVSTGFGSLANVRIPADRRAELQRALIRSHAAGMGPPVEREVVRAMMALRARSLAMGYSGARPIVAEAILGLLNAGITPVVPEHGSLGASGDLAPLAHCALALTGEGDVECDDGAVRPAPEALERAGIEPVVLEAKEGLALINGTDGMLGMLILAIADLRGLLKTADITAAMSVEGLLGTDPAFAADLQELRPQPGQVASAANLRALLASVRSWPATAAPRTRACRTPTHCAAPPPWPGVRGTRSRTRRRWRTRAAGGDRQPGHRSRTGAWPRTATSTGRRSATCSTSWPSWSPTARWPSGGPTAFWTPPAARACRRSWPRIRASTPG